MNISCRRITSSQNILGFLFKKGVKENQTENCPYERHEDSNSSGGTYSHSFSLQ
jgi:hypothetical protein